MTTTQTIEGITDDMGNPTLKYEIDPGKFAVDSLNRDGESKLIADSIAKGEFESVPQYVKDLADSIESVGLIQPIMVAPQQFGIYPVIAGNTRTLALQYLASQNRLGDRKVAFQVNASATDELARISIQFQENEVRQDLSPSQAMAYVGRVYQIISEHLKDQEFKSEKKREVAIKERTAKALNKSEGYVLQVLRLQESDPVIIKELKLGTFDLSVADNLQALSNNLALPASEVLAAFKDSPHPKTQTGFGKFRDEFSQTVKNQDVLLDAPAELHLEVESGAISSDVAALAQIESEATGVPAEQILEGAKVESSGSEVTEQDVSVASKKAKEKAELVAASDAELTEFEADFVEQWQLINLDSYDSEEILKAQKYVGKLFGDVVSLDYGEYGKALIQELIKKLLKLTPVSDIDRTVRMNSIKATLNKIDSNLVTIQQKEAAAKIKEEKAADVAKKKAEREAAKAEAAKAKAAKAAENAPENDVKPTKSKAKKAAKIETEE